MTYFTMKTYQHSTYVVAIGIMEKFYRTKSKPNPLYYAISIKYAPNTIV